MTGKDITDALGLCSGRSRDYFETLLDLAISLPSPRFVLADLLRQTAKIHNSTFCAVERSLSVILQRCWSQPELPAILQEIMGPNAASMPTRKAFLTHVHVFANRALYQKRNWVPLELMDTVQQRYSMYFYITASICLEQPSPFFSLSAVYRKAAFTAHCTLMMIRASVRSAIDRCWAENPIPPEIAVIMRGQTEVPPSPREFLISIYLYAKKAQYSGPGYALTAALRVPMFSGRILLAEAINLVLSPQAGFSRFYSQLCAQLGERFHRSIHTVHSEMRSALSGCFIKGNSALLAEILGHPLTQAPSLRDFLRHVPDYVSRSDFK